ncbi:hypothetical protein [Brachyspira alvinipulli]|uniref:hypothetical protein n=1 Tax=Brachyspira alvinipulli TaxID=84379 RepID=UPI00048354A1|nr:hypothetical protein [Brachyspira alvinipulli]
MKTKLFLILGILIVAISCSSPSNPTTDYNNTSNTVSDTKKNTLEVDEYYPELVYKGEGVYRINGETFPEGESIRIEIYDDNSIDVFRSKKYFMFENVKVKNNVYTAEQYHDGYRHTFEMTVTGDKAKVVYTIQGNNENYHFESDQIVKVVK